MKDVWRSWSRGSGGLSATTFGTRQMRRLCADNSVTLLLELSPCSLLILERSATNFIAFPQIFTVFSLYFYLEILLLP